MLTRSQWEKEEAQGRERKLQEEMALHREKLADGQEALRKACESALEARVRRGPEAAEGSLWSSCTRLRKAPCCLFCADTV